jgi:hypothetical protein
MLWMQLFATLYMTGLIWFVQLVHYPMLADVPRDAFVAFERTHQARTLWAVGPMMLLELATAVAMLVARPAGVPAWAPVAGLLLLAVVDGSTALYFGPLHGRLAEGFDESLHRDLVRWNWLRTVGWTARGALLLWVASLAQRDATASV